MNQTSGQRPRCVDCGKTTRPGHAHAADYPGTVRYARRGLCDSCDSRHTRQGTINDFDTQARRWDEIADDYAMLCADGYPIPVIAARLGMTPKALDQALCRHRDDPRACRPSQRHVLHRQAGAA